MKNSLANVPVINFLKIWVNKYLKAAGSQKEIKNFNDNLKDGEVNFILLNNTFVNYCDIFQHDISGINQKMEKVIDNVKKAGVNYVITPGGLVSGKESFGLLLMGKYMSYRKIWYNQSPIPNIILFFDY